MAVVRARSIPASSYRWVILGAATIVLTLSMGMLNSFGVFFKPVAAEFQWTRDVTAAAYSFYGIFEAAITPFSGIFTDKYGPRVVLAASGVMAGLGYFLVAHAHSLWQFYIFFGLFIGFSNGCAYSPLVSTINRWFGGKRGLAQGVLVSGVGMGTMLIPPLAAYVIGGFGSWRGAYLFFAALLGIGILSAAFVMRRSPAETRSQATPTTAGQQSSASPSITLKQAFRRRYFWMVFFVAVFSYGALSLVQVHLVNYATDAGVGLSAQIAATLVSTVGLASIVGKLGMGALSDRIGRRVSLLGCCGLAAAMMFYLPVAKSLGALYLFAAVFGFAYGGWTPVIPALVAELFGLRSTGAIFAMISLAGSVGAAIGSYLGGVVFEASRSYVIAFIAGAVVLAAAAFLASLIKDPGHRGVANV